MRPHHLKNAIHHWRRRPDLIGLLVLLVAGCSGTTAEEGPKPELLDPTSSVQVRGEGEPNQLAGETSPYLLQHAYNPVNWRPWGPEAFEAAKKLDKPVFLSVGYSSCYWCHVMERESFENEEIAEYLNEHFICIKVDREERPDVDKIYMTAVQAISGGGGWPMSMFLTPDAKPFFGGTYFPPEPRNGMPSFPQLLEAITAAWTERREDLNKDADNLASFVQRVSGGGLSLDRVPVTAELVRAGLEALGSTFDSEYGGFGYSPDQPNRPKFPQPANLVFLLDQHRRNRGSDLTTTPLEMVTLTLDHMARGGIRDFLAGGYHRYSTDRFWAVPHFEKMLYDNAQLVSLHLEIFEETSNDRWRQEAEDTLAFISNVMTGPEGAFYSALDAETDAEEGKYYVWTRDEVQSVLGETDGVDLFLKVFGFESEPNFEGGRFVLLRPEDVDQQASAAGISVTELESRLAPLKTTLLRARQKREMPFLDDKVLTSWNGLMIGAYADAFRVLGKDEYKSVAEGAANFVLRTLRTEEGRLLHTYREGKAKLPGYLEDYAYFIDGLLRLHRATNEVRWLDEAQSLADRMIADFLDETNSGFFFTADDHESLIARVKDAFDGALPSPNALAIQSLLTLHLSSDDPYYLEVTGRALDFFAPTLQRQPSGGPLMLMAIEQYLEIMDGESNARVVDPKPIIPGFAPGRLELDPSSNPREEPAIVTGTVQVNDSAKVESGAVIELQVELTIKQPYHLNANPAGQANLIPTTLVIPKESGVALLGVDYPKGRMADLGGLGTPIPVYDGTIDLRAQIQLPQDLEPASLELPIVIRYQACDDRSCLPPNELTLKYTFKSNH